MTPGGCADQTQISFDRDGECLSEGYDPSADILGSGARRAMIPAADSTLPSLASLSF